jgi:hypothetical protein
MREKELSAQPAECAATQQSYNSLLLRIADLRDRVEYHIALAHATARIAQALYQDAYAKLDELQVAHKWDSALAERRIASNDPRILPDPRLRSK